MAKWVYLNDGFIEEEKAVLHIKDLSFQRGYGVFDFFRLSGNSPLFLEDHLNRFYFSAAGLHLPVPVDRHELTHIINELIGKNNTPDTGIRISLTGGYSEDGFSIATPNLVLSQHSFSPPTAKQIEEGIRLASYPYQRPLPQIKTIDYLMAVWLQPWKTDKGADDILYHHNGLISESPRSNIFLITGDDRVITPLDNALHGITRKKVLSLARQHFGVEERAIGLEELKKAKEVFITSTSKQILPVRQIDDIVFEEKKTTLFLLELFRSACSAG